MKQLTNKDLINIIIHKGNLININDEIKAVIVSSSAPCDKMDQIFELYKQRYEVITKASLEYPHINWMDQAIGKESSFKNSVKNTIKLKIMDRLHLN